MSERVDVVRLKQLQACAEASTRALLLGLRCHAAGMPRQALAWYERADSGGAFAACLAEYLRSRRCLTR